MFSPFKLLQEIYSERKYLSSIEDSEKFFEKQVAAISGIKDTTGYREIRMFWVREREATIDRLCSIQSNELAEYKALQAQAKQAQRFIDYLDAMSE